MTKKEEFLNYIESFHKNPGEYTREEEYEIGLRHKELDVADRNWNELVGILGVLSDDGKPKSGETFRTWIKGKQAAEGCLPKNIKMLSGRTIEDVSIDEINFNLEEQKRDLYKQEVRTRDVYRAYREVIRGEARKGRFIDAIQDNIKELNKFEPIKFENYKPDGLNEGVLLFSDLHLGAVIDNYYNTYNMEIAKKRVGKLATDVIEYCKIFKIKRLNVLNLGDCIHGLIHVTARIEQEIDVVKQIMLASEIIAEFLNKIQEAAPEVIYRSCTDNHSRAVADIRQNIESENFGKIIDFYLEARLKGTNIIFVNDNLDEDIGLFDLLNGKKMAFTHGHRDNYTTAFQNFVGATKQYIDYIAMGHYHNSKVKSFQGAKVFVNGSIIGSESYAQSKRLYGPAEQTFLVFAGENLSVNYINLDIKN